MNLSSLSLLRFSAAVIVILFHYKEGSKFLKAAPEFLTAGPQMVTFFFVLSGYVLVLAYYDKPYFSLKDYWAKRTARIIPIYLIALVLTGLPRFIKGELDPIALILNITLLQSWVPPYPLSINSPAWFLSDLFFFYATFPPTLSYIKKSAPNPKLLLFAALFLWLGTQAVLTPLFNSTFYKGYPSPSHDLVYYFPPAHYCSFFMGIAGAYFAVKNRKSINLSPASSNLLVLMSCFSVAACIEAQDFISRVISIKLPFDTSFYAPLFLSVIFIFTFAKSALTNFLSLKLFIVMGELSFAVYIMQSPLYLITYHFLKRLNIPYDFKLLIYLLVLLATGVFLLYAVENQVKAYVNKRFNDSAKRMQCP